jgi:hypothetical protein
MAVVFVVFFVLVLNFGISWFNAYSVGRSWADSKAIGGWTRFMVWCGAIMSASGFTWCYLVIFAFIAMASGTLPTSYIQLMLEVGYVVIIFPILGSGLAIWIDSVTTAYRQRNVRSIGMAGWNTFAMAHNTYSAARTMPKVLEDIGKLLSKGSGKGKLVALVMLLVLLAVCSGMLTTAAIIRSTARKYANKVLDQHRTDGVPTRAN